MNNLYYAELKFAQNVVQTCDSLALGCERNLYESVFKGNPVLRNL